MGLEHMRILVTGNQGYVGSVLAPELARAGHDVSGLDTFLYGGCDFGAAQTEIPTFYRDVRDVNVGELEGFDAVVHLAALSNDPVGDLSEEWTYEINLEGTLHIARTAKEAGVPRFVFASSCSMYGVAGGDALLGESAPLRPITAYAESKVRAEEGLWELADESFAPVSMRNATVYGIAPRLRLDVVLNNLAGWAHTAGAIRLFSDGMSWRPLVHVRDLTRAALTLLDAPAEVVSGEAFNVGSLEQNYLVRDLAEMLADVTGCDVEFAAEASPDPRSYRVDFTKLQQTFPDLEFEWDARRGAHELIAAYRGVPLTTELFEGRKYVRLRQLRHLLDSGELGEGLRWPSASVI
jgi:nucleoside-diphosphate-sugar epimerase